LSKFILISYYTVNTPYEQEAKEFEIHLQKFPEIEYKIFPIKSQGNWTKNTNQKALICLEAFNMFSKPIVYTDVDSRIHSYPKLFDTLQEYDIGVHYRKDRELLSGTIYFNHNETIKQLLNAWVKQGQDFPGVWDQKNLAKVLSQVTINIYKLPPTYCQIFDIMRNEGTPVIEHFQASRKFKRGIL
jgi:hypothetical protein